MSFKCYICSFEKAKIEVETKSFLAIRCVNCNQITSTHLIKDENIEKSDYWDQHKYNRNNQIAFEQTLEATRRKQALKIIKLADSLIPSAASKLKVLDVGAGKGWFLDELRNNGYKTIAGAETSVWAVENLKSLGINAYHIDLENPNKSFNKIIEEYKPDVITLLDVIEHFSDKEIHSLFNENLSNVKYVIIKVPNSEGFFYTTSKRIFKRGLSKDLIEQLYQVNTFPPHFQYFNTHSLKRLLNNYKFTISKVVYDKDFDIGTFKNRVRSLSDYPKVLGAFIGSIVYGLIYTLKKYDAIIIVGKNTRN